MAIDAGPIRVYAYRWILLAAFALLQGVLQLLWITFAPVTGDAAAFYGVSPLDIGFLSMLFMIVYLFVSIPASWVLDTYGLRVGVGIGALLVGGFGLLRGLYGSSYSMVLLSTAGLSVAQPFVLNSITKFGAHWFPLQERATAAGVAVLTQYAGIVIAMWATPQLSLAYGIPGTLRIYGVLSLVSAVLFLVLLREHPPTPPGGPEASQRVRVRDGLRHIFGQRDMRYLLLIFFIGLGIFNAVTTWIEQMVRPRGFSVTDAGAVGAIMMVGGIAGASILPPLSDRFRTRKALLLLALACSVPGLVGLTFATGYTGLMASGFLFGFFSMAAGPIFYQYSAEVSLPAPEATSQGLLVLAGQISGILFIYGMDFFRGESGSMTPFLLVLLGLAVLNVGLTARLRESTLIHGVGEPPFARLR